MNARGEDLRIAEEAADWLLRLQTEPKSDCREDFIAWLKHSPRHIEELLLMSATMRVARQGGRAAGVDSESLIQEANPHVVAFARAEMSQPKLRAPLWRRRKPLLAAAAAILACALAVLAAHFSSYTYVTPVGEQRNIKLPDGSFVYLNTRSRLKVDYSNERRDVRLLEGEALFVVARDAGRPFRVFSDSFVIQAVGTQFNVYRSDLATTVSVIEGKVRIARSTGLLSAGDQAQVTENGRVLKTRPDDIRNAVAWRQRRLVFQNDTLADIAREFNRYNGMQIQIEGEAAEQRRFTAVFNADEPQALLMFLRDDPQLVIGLDSGHPVIRSRPSPGNL
jgi:transmembrane sensor